MPVTASAPGAPVFVLTVAGIPGAVSQKIVFQELGSLVSEIDPVPSTAAPAPGAPVTHTKAPFGQTVPPSVTLKRGMDGDNTLWQWHQLALEGSPPALQNAALAMYAASDYAAGKPPLATWELMNAWCAKIAVAGAGAVAGTGPASAVAETVQIVCDRIAFVRPVTAMPA